MLFDADPVPSVVLAVALLELILPRVVDVVGSVVSTDGVDSAVVCSVGDMLGGSVTIGTSTRWHWTASGQSHTCFS